MIEPFKMLEFIRKIHLFRGLSDEELTTITEKMQEVEYAPGEIIIRQGEDGDRFYVIHSGKVNVTRKTGSSQKNLADLVTGDHFGEDALLKQTNRTATITAKEQTTLLAISRADLLELMRNIHGLRAKLEVTIASHRLARRTRLSWLEDSEVVYFITRKHQIILLKSLAGPILGLLVPIIALIMFLLYPASSIYLWAAGLSLLFLAVWIFLKWLDWSNDYYIVTNRRVLFVEKVIALYDSRQEAPLTAILSVNTQSDVVGRTFGYGDVIVRTFVGNITFKNIGYPGEVEALLREYWERTKRSSRQANVEAMKLSIRQKLGLAETTQPPQPPKLATKPIYKFNLFKVRFEEKGIITYRKHWVVWFKQTWLPGILSLSVLGFIIWDFFKNGVFGRDTSLLLVLFFFVFTPLALWWLYQTIDWSNDKFQVTEDQIFDIDKTPLGRMQKNVAPLDNILNLEARREGLLQMLFNYGNVYISVGGTQMVFENVINPDAVQQDIDQRRVARREKQDRDRNEAERERLAEFFAAYHQNASGFQNELEEFARQKEATDQSESDPETDETDEAEQY